MRIYSIVRELEAPRGMAPKGREKKKTKNAKVGISPLLLAYRQRALKEHVYILSHFHVCARIYIIFLAYFPSNTCSPSNAFLRSFLPLLFWRVQNSRTCTEGVNGLQLVTKVIIAIFRLFNQINVSFYYSLPLFAPVVRAFDAYLNFHPLRLR